MAMQKNIEKLKGQVKEFKTETSRVTPVVTKVQSGPTGVSSGRRQYVAELPRNINFDGRGNWWAFKNNFTRYAEVSRWTPAEQLNCLCWSLSGKASEYFAMIAERDPEMSFYELFSRLES